MRRLSAAVAAVVLMLFGSVVMAGAASADPVTVTITAPGDAGDDTTPLVQGMADPGAAVHVLLDGTEAAVVNADQAGSWEYQVTAPFTRGESVSILAQVLDGQGDVAASAEVIYLCWPEPISITITSPAPGTVIGRFPEVLGKVAGDDRNITLALTLDGKVVDDQAGFDDIDAGTVRSSAFLEEISDGPHTLQFVGTDSFGREFASQEVAVIGDGTAPKAPVLLSPADGSTVKTKHFTFHGTGTPGDTVYVMNDRSGEPYTDRVVVRPDGTFDAPIYASSKPPFNPLDGLDGQRRTVGFLLVEVDPVGNESSSGFSLTFDLRTAAAPAPKPAPAKPASAVPAVAPNAAPAAELANTGASTLPGTVAALLLIATGLGLTTASRKLAPARR